MVFFGVFLLPLPLSSTQSLLSLSLSLVSHQPTSPQNWCLIYGFCNSLKRVSKSSTSLEVLVSLLLGLDVVDQHKLMMMNFTNGYVEIARNKRAIGYLKIITTTALCNYCGFNRSLFFVFSILYSREKYRSEEIFCSRWLKRFWFVMVCVSGSMGGKWLFWCGLWWLVWVVAWAGWCSMVTCVFWLKIS